jgi:AcrR family transcriptional regulator
MVRQARSELTRQKIITSAVDLIDEIGYAAAGLGDIIERAEMTKGALYYHFESKEALATAIIEEGVLSLANAFRTISESSSPTLENIIHGVFVVAERVATDKIARVATHLSRAFGKFNAAARFSYQAWLQEMSEWVEQARAEGDLREDLDTGVIAETIIAAMLGAELLSNTISGGDDLRDRIGRTWEILLPTIVTDESLGYFREYLARESLRLSPER